ncbi:hypothetical protein ACFL50_01645 [Candidatus Latescibacterota bacterium]
MKKIPVILTILILALYPILQADEEDILKIMELTMGLGANDLGEIAWDGDTLWLEGSGSLVKLVGEGYSLSDWITYKEMDGFGRGSISALSVSGDTLLAAWSYTAFFNGENTYPGDGISISLDAGATWDHVKVTDMFPERVDWPVPAEYFTRIYDIEFLDGTIWCPTTNGFLLKSDDLGLSWVNIIPDDIPDTTEYKFQFPNYHGQCVDVYGNTLWVGTFLGMNVSFDRGESWTNFSWPEDGSEPVSDQLPGNFPVAVEHTIVDGKTYVWVASRQYYGQGKDGICVTTDNGQTWEYKKDFEFGSTAWNFAFGHSGASDARVSESTVYAATDAGLIVSYDLGDNWETIPIRVSDDLYWEENSSISSVAIAGEDLWVTSSDGAARSKDWGESWEIFKGVTRVQAIDTGNRNIGISSEYDILEGDLKTYAFPNPFSPKRQHKDYSRTRIQYAIENDARVTIKIYSYSGNLIKELIDNEDRSGGRDYQEVWDGTDGTNSIVPNGVYFYIINTNKGDSARGKIMVLD